MTPREMIILHFGIYYGRQTSISETTQRMYDLTKALKVPMSDLDDILKDIVNAMEGMKVLDKITDIKYYTA